MLSLPVAVLASYLLISFVDLPLALWINERGLDQHKWMLFFLSTPVVLAPLGGLYVLVYVVRRAWSEPSQRERGFLTISIALLASMAVKDMLKRMFGRTWPRNVVDPGPDMISACPPPSLGYINDGLHSFHFFGGTSKPFLAFPSGSTVMLLAIILPFCAMYPRARIPMAAFVTISLTCFVLTNTHFISDVVAGAYVGMVAGLVAIQATRAHRA